MYQCQFDQLKREKCRHLPLSQSIARRGRKAKTRERGAKKKWRKTRANDSALATTRIDVRGSSKNNKTRQLTTIDENVLASRCTIVSVGVASVDGRLYMVGGYLTGRDGACSNLPAVRSILACLTFSLFHHNSWAWHGEIYRRNGNVALGRHLEQGA